MITLDINLEHLINKVLVAKSENNDRDYGHFHPSEFYQCHRKIIYKFYESKGICKADNASSYIPPVLQRIFDNGHFLHARLGQNMVDTGLIKGNWKCWDCQTVYGVEEHLGIPHPGKCPDCDCKKFSYREVGFMDEETFFGGHVDCILDLRGQDINGESVSTDASLEDSHIIVDYKSIRSEAFRRLSGPKDSHYSQMQIYLYLSGLKFGKVLYENKNDQQFLECLVVRDDKFVNEQVTAAKSLKKIVTNTNSEGRHTLPVRAYKRDGNKECKECPFRAHCWGLKK